MKITLTELDLKVAIQYYLKKKNIIVPSLDGIVFKINWAGDITIEFNNVEPIN